MTKLFLACVFFAAVSFPAAADSIVSVFASFGSNTCSRSAPDGASCDVPGTASSPGLAFASVSAPPAPGFILLDLFAQGANASTSADIHDMDFIRVNGVTGSGSVQADFYGFGGAGANVPGTAALSPVSVTIGGYATTFTLHSPGYNTYSVVAPINFGTLTPFSISLTASASSTVYNNMASNGVLVNLFPPGSFTVFDANGNVLPNASVEYYVPESATWFIVALGLIVLPIVRRVHRQA